MAGHSHWAGIKHKKGRADKERSKIFSKLSREITVAAKLGDKDPNMNPRLRAAVQNAKSVNMPKDNVQRAIKKASGDEADTYFEVTYEGYAPNGIAVIIECTTDNINRTVAEVRSVFNKSGGELGKNGSLEFLFEKKGVFLIEKTQFQQSLEEVEMELIDYGLEEFEVEENLCSIICHFDKFGLLQNKLASMSIEAKTASIQRLPNDTVTLDDLNSLKILNIIEKFEDLDDVQQVFHNLKLTEEVIEKLNNEA